MIKKENKQELFGKKFMERSTYQKILNSQTKRGLKLGTKCF